ncbi:PREDICTED: uncharacterized protein LOC109114487 [Nelumbo nucifera]|uniref:Uncharacterized protein LOC109114487 n=1 Tax=Nelumbo nucifera TaxID=4432 RepID=A0A1U8Q1N0_NELNU|nr:PREDICTED: uncharacterized protein LOC109114487 [Nelumbo nucifera]
MVVRSKACRNTDIKDTDYSNPMSPYYLGTSDNPGMVLVTTLLNGDNYPIWKRAMTNALWAKNKIGFIDGTILKPDQTKPVELFAWKKCNSMELALLRQDNLSISMYYMKMKAIWDELSTYIPVPVCTCCTRGVMKDLVAKCEKGHIYQFLMGLNDRFNTVRSNNLGMEPLPYVSKAYALITQEEKRQLVTWQQSLTIEAIVFHVTDQAKGGSKNANLPKINQSSVVITTKRQDTAKIAATNSLVILLVGI